MDVGLAGLEPLEESGLDEHGLELWVAAATSLGIGIRLGPSA